MVALLVPDDLWAAISPLLPAGPEKPKGGRLRVPDRGALADIWPSPAFADTITRLLPLNGTPLPSARV